MVAGPFGPTVVPSRGPAAAGVVLPVRSAAVVAAGESSAELVALAAIDRRLGHQPVGRQRRGGVAESVGVGPLALAGAQQGGLRGRDGHPHRGEAVERAPVVGDAHLVRGAVGRVDGQRDGELLLGHGVARDGDPGRRAGSARAVSAGGRQAGRRREPERRRPRSSSPRERASSRPSPAATPARRAAAAPGVAVSGTTRYAPWPATRYSRRGVTTTSSAPPLASWTTTRKAW